jgi:arginase family enzyme
MTSRTTLIGVGWDRSSSFQRGAAGAPDVIRAALWSPSSNTWNERGDDLSQPQMLGDAGNLSLPDDPAAAREAITHGVAALIAEGHRPLALGGDHSITYPVLRAWQDAGPHLSSCTSSRTATSPPSSRATATRTRARSHA